MEKHNALADALEAISDLRSGRVQLHSITNTVAQNFTANVLLACGASVSMTTNPFEIDSFVQHANALHINLGTLDNERKKAITRAIYLADSENKPILIDPVKVDVSFYRRHFTQSFLASASIIRGNAQEMMALDFEDRDTVCFVQTGQSDTVEYAGQTVKISNGHPIMDQVIATGCAMGALVAALAATATSPYTAGIAGCLWFSVAGELAAETSKGPGSFQTAFLDALNSVEIDTIRERANLV